MSIINAKDQEKKGQSLDILAVETWLKKQNIDLVGQVEITPFLDGVSTWTYRLKYENVDLVLRRSPKHTDFMHNIVHEYHIQEQLKTLYPVVPKMLALCQDQSVLGCNFYVMQYIAGITLSTKLPPELQLEEADVHQLCINFLDQLIELHQVPYQNTALEQRGNSQDYCRKQVKDWDIRYQKVKTLNVPSFKVIRAWLYKNIPEYSNACIIHNDWRFDNVILNSQNPTEIIGVLDWDMATIGDPLMDLGIALAYWVEATDNMVIKSTRRQPTHIKGMFTRKQAVEYYLKKTAIQTENWAFYEVFGIFRLAVIAQQFYNRYYHKKHPNQAYKAYWILIHTLHFRALKLIASYQLENHQVTQAYLKKLKGFSSK